MHTLYEVNSEVWLREQTWAQGPNPDLSDIPDAQIQEWQDLGFDGVWFLGVWTKGEATRRICLDSKPLMEDFQDRLPDFRIGDVSGSPFSIAAYRINPALGDDRTLPRLRDKLHARGMKLILDFVPNHLAVDHPWTQDHPERFVGGTPQEMDMEPGNWFRVPGQPGRILAHGRDPYFPGWTDTAQLNAFSTEARRAMIELLVGVADQCDGVRCDMAMLLLNSVFKRTWGDISAIDYPDADPPEFWEEAIGAVRDKYPDFLFLAEVYWDLEKRLLDLGFDFTYDKTLYDHLIAGRGAETRERLHVMQNQLPHLVHFIENHDEARAARSLGIRHGAAANIIAALPGLALYHEGQFDGRKTRLPVQLNRRPREDADEDLRGFYHRLLPCAAQTTRDLPEFEVPWVSRGFGQQRDLPRPSWPFCARTKTRSGWPCRTYRTTAHKPGSTCPTIYSPAMSLCSRIA